MDSDPRQQFVREMFLTMRRKEAGLSTAYRLLELGIRLWRPGWMGAARLGLAHGIYCLGCCAALMALLFVFGVMNLVWVAALALFVLVEKLLPIGSASALNSATRR